MDIVETKLLEAVAFYGYQYKSVGQALLMEVLSDEHAEDNIEAAHALALLAQHLRWRIEG